MELTPQTLREVEFREKLRGYHPDDVDEFLEAVAVALDTLLTRLHDAEANAAGAPAATAASPAVVSDGERVTEETLRRTLLLAQKTADLAVAEAEDTARQIVDSARDEASRLIDTAKADAAAMTRDAKEQAEASVSDLEQRRNALEREVASLHTWATQQRDRLRDVLTDQVRALDIWMATNAARPGGNGRTVGSLLETPTAGVEADDSSLASPAERSDRDDLDPPSVSLPPIPTEAADVTVVLAGGDDGLDDDRLDDRLGGRLFRRR